MDRLRETAVRAGRPSRTLGTCLLLMFGAMFAAAACGGINARQGEVWS
jgi:hypothetical protein